MSELPHCDELFLRFFDRWYDDDDRRRKGFRATRPDLYQGIDSLAGITPIELAQQSRLAPECRKDVANRIQTILRAAHEDWSRHLSVSGDLNLQWIEAFDAHYQEDQIASVIASSVPEDYANDYLVLSCEFGAALGQVLRQLEGRLLWRYEWPYWESDLVDPVSGNVIPVFHWAIKKMSGYGWDDGFVAKIHLCLHVLREPASP